MNGTKADAKSKKIILFVCTGNTCRSPIAKALLQSKLKHAGLDSLYTCESCGIAPHEGDPMSYPAQAVLQEHGILSPEQASRHKAKIIDLNHMEQASYIFCMTEYQKKILCTIAPHLAGKIFAMSENITDPYGKTLDAYRACYKEIDLQLNLMISDLHRQARHCTD